MNIGLILRLVSSFCYIYFLISVHGRAFARFPYILSEEICFHLAVISFWLAALKLISSKSLNIKSGN